MYTVDVYVDSDLESLHGVGFDTVTDVSEICAASMFVPVDGGRMYFRSIGITVRIYIVLFYLITSAFK